MLKHRKYYPYVAQRDSEDCGIACLTMVFRYLVGYIQYNTIEAACELEHTGLSLQGIIAASQKIGFNSTAFYAKANFFNSQIKKFPLIALVNKSHFIVIYNIKIFNNKNYLVIADPRMGIKTVSLEKFCKQWYGDNQKGILIHNAPTARCNNFICKQKSLNEKLKIFIQYFYQHKKSIIYIGLTLFLLSIIQMLFPIITQSIVDHGIGKKDISFIWLIMIAQISLIIGKTIMEVSRAKVTLFVSSRFNLELISDYVYKLLNLPMRFIRRRSMGDLLERLYDHERIVNFLTTDLISIVFSVVNFIIYGIILAVYHINIFLMYMLGILLYITWTTLFLKKRKSLDYEYFTQQSNNSNTTFELLNFLEDIKLQNCKIKKRFQWENVQADEFAIKLKRQNLYQMNLIGATFINQGRDVIISIITALLVIKGQLTLGILLAVQYIMGQMISPVDDIVNFLYKWQDLSIGLERINDIYNANDENLNSDVIINPSKIQDIYIKNVSYKYGSFGAQFALKNITATIPKNSVTAIVGHSGSGKTTLLKLILGFDKPSQGDIFIGHTSISKINKEKWWKQCGIVMQDGNIFSDSIVENIAIGDDVQKPSKDNILQTLKMANIDEFVDGLPRKYNTKVGTAGRGLSKGQIQRILIARVIYKNPNYVFLDEATNSLDTKNENQIIKNLENFYKGKTAIIIAHRMSTVKHADQIIVLDQGQIVECGKHEDLIAKRGKYFELVSNQLEL